ncbi:hypothetical protein ASG92_09630 [Arthrobacter sp. Soil736]|uniref:hypothetical protein n=1 Tax=Arthrobacter sp. Soil736 TaxID=1736395 RepID=UPI0006FFA8A2|nr:hypothetical protein [Arthrobacter sp. Soil736]KRE50516.1 hypothetical protein ASG92_09630 [Arthrobacter sp. Soil736]
MKPQAKIPGAMLALFAFVLTVLLGIGGAAAVALWQQSATATMTVSAGTNWGPLITLACTNSVNEKTATLTVSAAQTPTTLTMAARRADGTYGPTEYPAGTGTGPITLTELSPIVVANAGATPLTVRVTATFADLEKSIAEWSFTIAGGGKVKCTP